MRNTLILAFAAVLIGFPFGIVLGAIAGYANGSAVDKAVTALAITGVSVPHYWLGIVLVIIFAVNLDVLPAMGMGPGGQAAFALGLHPPQAHPVLPAITLSVIPPASSRARCGRRSRTC